MIKFLKIFFVPIDQKTSTHISQSPSLSTLLGYTSSILGWSICKIYMLVCVYVFVYVFMCVSPHQSEVRHNFVAYTVDSKKLYSILSKSDAIWDFTIKKKRKEWKKGVHIVH